MVQVAVSRLCKLECPKADVVEGFVVKYNNFVTVFNKLVNRERGVVGFHDDFRNKRSGHHCESHHYSVRVLFAQFGQQKSAQA